MRERNLKSCSPFNHKKKIKILTILLHTFIPSKLNNWKHFSLGATSIWIVGPHENIVKPIIKKIATTKSSDINEIKSLLNGIDGHFCAVILSESYILAAVDCIRTTPIFYTMENESLILSPQANLIAEKTSRSINSDQLIAFRMSGYVTGEKTLWDEIFGLNPGSFLLFSNENPNITIQNYFTYQPWLIKKENHPNYDQELKHHISELIKKIISDVNGRRIIIPLSAGYDSRLIASGLKEWGYENVKCFAYGLKGNFEIKASKKIAKKLGFDWQEVAINRKNARDLFQSDCFKDIISNTLDGCSVIGNQDIYVINYLKNNGYFNKDDVIITGQTGDFISGGHISSAPENLKEKKINHPDFDILFTSFFTKHYSLWGSLANEDNQLIIKNLLLDQIKFIGSENIYPYGVFELLEFENRQAKYVTNFQRIYDYYEINWLLPLWGKDFIEFWSDVPALEKVNQKLYKKVLKDMNMGGVWGSSFEFEYSPQKGLVHFIRQLSKILFLFKGKDKWSKMDRKFFSYWNDIICAYSVVPYKDVLSNHQDPRNSVSWNALIVENALFGSSWQDNN